MAGTADSASFSFQKNVSVKYWEFYTFVLCYRGYPYDKKLLQLGIKALFRFVLLSS